MVSYSPLMFYASHVLLPSVALMPDSSLSIHRRHSLLCFTVIVIRWSLCSPSVARPDPMKYTQLSIFQAEVKLQMKFQVTTFFTVNYGSFRNWLHTRLFHKKNFVGSFVVRSFDGLIVLFIWLDTTLHDSLLVCFTRSVRYALCLFA